MFLIGGYYIAAVLKISMRENAHGSAEANLNFATAGASKLFFS